MWELRSPPRAQRHRGDAHAKHKVYRRSLVFTSTTLHRALPLPNTFSKEGLKRRVEEARSKHMERANPFRLGPLPLHEKFTKITKKIAREAGGALLSYMYHLPLSACGLMPLCCLSAATKARPCDRDSRSCASVARAASRSPLSFSRSVRTLRGVMVFGVHSEGHKKQRRRRP